MDARDIKREIIREERIEDLLEALGCEHIKREQRGKLITASLPERFHSDNKRAVQVYATEGAPAKIRNISGFSGDVFSLVSFLEFNSPLDDLQQTFRDALMFITNLFGWSASSGKRRKDYTAGLKKLASLDRNYSERVPNDVIDDSVLSNFRSIADHGWYLEGISIDTQYKYGVGFDYMSSRITIPIRNEENQLVGVKGRSINDSDVNDYNPKYMYLYNCNISQEWFNMNHARENIIESKKVYIFESEKSVMKMDTYGYYNSLAISSSDISEIQVRMIKNLGLDIDIVLCYDKDKTVDEVKEQAKRFTNRNVYGIMDLDDKLNEKDAPVDRGFEIWEELLENNVYPISMKNNNEGDN